MGSKVMGVVGGWAELLMLEPKVREHRREVYMVLLERMFESNVLADHEDFWPQRQVFWVVE